MTVPDVPLLEDDLAHDGVIAARAVVPRHVVLPPVAVLCWFREVVDDLAATGEVVTELTNEAGRHAVCVVERDGVRVAVVQPGLGGPLAAVVVEELAAMGVRTFVGCGAAGALLPGLVLGHAIVVDSAVRDEGTSFHYLPPARVVPVEAAVVETLVATAESAGVTHVVGRTWTTDAIFRETRARTDRRVAEGCVAVEMEAASVLAVCAARGLRYGQYLMAGDTLAGEEWEHRSWTTATEARAALFDLALTAAVALA